MASHSPFCRIQEQTLQWLTHHIWPAESASVNSDIQSSSLHGLLWDYVLDVVDNLVQITQASPESLLPNNNLLALDFNILLLLRQII